MGLLGEEYDPPGCPPVPSTGGSARGSTIASVSAVHVAVHAKSAMQAGVMGSNGERPPCCRAPVVPQAKVRHGLPTGVCSVHSSIHICPALISTSMAWAASQGFGACCRWHAQLVMRLSAWWILHAGVDLLLGAAAR